MSIPLSRCQPKKNIVTLIFTIPECNTIYWHTQGWRIKKHSQWGYRLLISPSFTLATIARYAVRLPFPPSVKPTTRVHYRVEICEPVDISEATFSVVWGGARKIARIGIDVVFVWREVTTTLHTSPTDIDTVLKQTVRQIDVIQVSTRLTNIYFNVLCSHV